jgi:hypothetical protein
LHLAILRLIRTALKILRRSLLIRGASWMLVQIHSHVATGARRWILLTLNLTLTHILDHGQTLDPIRNLPPQKANPR